MTRKGKQYDFAVMTADKGAARRGPRAQVSQSKFYLALLVTNM